MNRSKSEKDVLFHDGEHGKIVEIRAASDDGEEGIVEAYLTKWDTVDSWGTSFRKGAFKNTIKRRGSKGVRLIWNHEELAGKVLDLREDSYGPLAVVQFNLETRSGKEAFAHVKAGDISCFSFGFRTVKDGWKDQVREIQEVELFECGPVVFEANSEAKITDVRSVCGNDARRVQGKVEGDVETRSTDFDETQQERELNAKGWQLVSSLDRTLDDIYYRADNPGAETIIGEVDTAIAKFHTAYMTWLREYYDYYESRGGKAPCEFRNKLQVVARSLDMSDIAKRTSLTEDEVGLLAKGKLLPVSARSKLDEVDSGLKSAHAETRSRYIEILCDELRSGGLNQGERDRVLALLTNAKSNLEIDIAMEVISDFRANLNP